MRAATGPSYCLLTLPRHAVLLLSPQRFFALPLLYTALPEAKKTGKDHEVWRLLHAPLNSSIKFYFIFEFTLLLSLRRRLYRNHV